MIDCKGSYFIKDSSLFSADSVELLASDAILIYEVVRIVDSICLFLEDHYERLKNSASLMGIPVRLTRQDFKDSIGKLIEANKLTEGNVKILIQYGNSRQSTFFFFIPHSYPLPKDYKEGVKADFLMVERVMPQAKVVQQKLRDESNRFIYSHQLYDAILVNGKNHILEGSRTNIFFVKDDHFYTPPSDFVLSGITRQNVIECLDELGFAFEEKVILIDSVSDYDAVFFTGTSPKILPISHLGQWYFSPTHDPVLKLIKAYDEKIRNYLRENK